MTVQERKSPAGTGLIQNNFDDHYMGPEVAPQSEPVPLEQYADAFWCDDEPDHSDAAAWADLAEPVPSQPYEPEELIALEDMPGSTLAAAVSEQAWAGMDGELPGRLGDLQVWIMRKMRRPSALGSAAVALAIAGHLYGRRFLGPTELGQNLLVVVCAATGTGKDALVKAPPTLLDAVSERLGMSICGQFASRPAMHEFLQDTPAAFAALDEVGHLLRGMSDPRQGHLHDLGGFWLELFSAAGKAKLIPRRRRQEKGTSDLRPIKWPHFCAVGATTPAMLGEALSSQMTAAGQLNRLLVATLDDWNGKRQEPEFSTAPPHWWKAWALAQIGRGAKGDQEPVRMGWLEDARAVWREHAEALEDALEHEPETTRELRNRDAEHALKIAQILALSDERGNVSGADLEWAFGFVERLQRGVLQLCRAEGILSGATLDAIAESAAEVMQRRGVPMTEGDLSKYCRPFGRTRGADRQHALRLLQESHGAQKMPGRRGAVRYYLTS